MANFVKRKVAAGARCGRELDFYREIIKNAGKHLNKKGWLYFEIGQGQKDAVYNLMQEEGFEDIQVVKDYNKIERIIYGRVGR